MSVMLEPGRERSGSSRPSAGAQFVVAPDVREVRFGLSVSGLMVYEQYQVVVGTPERPSVFHGPAKMESGAVIAIVPSDLLTVGDYTLELQGVVPNSSPQSIATYYFRSAR